MKKSRFYVGSNNETGKLEAEKIESIVSKYFDGFTEIETAGFWKGLKEKTLIIEVISEKSDSELVKIAKELKISLNQESILLETVESNSAFVN